MTPAEPAPDAHAQKRNLDRHVAGGLAWTAGGKWATQLVTWGSLFIFARLLTPADFGIVEMASTYTIFTNLLAEFGVGTAVLHMPELDRKALGQLHSFSCLLCTLTFVLTSLGAPLIAAFFHTPNLRWLIVVNNLGFFITGFQAVPMGLLQRDMDFRRLSIMEAIQAVTQGVVTVAAAWFGLGYWSLVAGPGCAKVITTILVNVWKPVSFSFPQWKNIRTPLELGRQVAVGRLAWAAYSYSDTVIVGRVLGDTLLGTYRMAMNLATAPADKISMLLMRAAGPLFANVQYDVLLVRRYFLILVEMLSLTVMPMLTGLVMVAPVAIPLVLGHQWTSAVVPLQWLAGFIILKTIAVLMEQVLVSQRATRFTMRMSLLNLCIMPVAFFFAARWRGIAGVAESWVVLSPLTVLPFAFVLLRKIELPWRELGLALWPALASSAVMALGLAGAGAWLTGKTWPQAAVLATEISTGGAVYGLTLLVMFRARILRYVMFLRQMRGKEAPVAAAF